MSNFNMNKLKIYCLDEKYRWFYNSILTNLDFRYFTTINEFYFPILFVISDIIYIQKK